VAELIARVDGKPVGQFTEEHLTDGSQFRFEYLDGVGADRLVSLTRWRVKPCPSGKDSATARRLDAAAAI
jgi:hypothetical protein